MNHSAAVHITGESVDG